MNLSTHSIGLLLALITGLSWSVLAIALKVAVVYASTGTIVWFRFLIAFSSLAVYFIVNKNDNLKPQKHFKLPIPIILCGILLGINYYGFMKGIELTSASNAQIFIQLAPLSLILMGLFYFKENFSRKQLVGFLIAVSGFSLFYQDQIFLSWQNREQYLTGNMWIFLAAITWTLYATIQKKISFLYSSSYINLVIYATCTFMLLPLVQWSDFSHWTFPILILMISLGLNTVLAYGCLSLALKWAPASQTSLIISCNPLLTLLFLYLLEVGNVSWINPEPISSQGYIGAFIVISGVILSIPSKKEKPNI